jgi:hypothetical protein
MVRNLNSPAVTQISIPIILIDERARALNFNNVQLSTTQQFSEKKGIRNEALAVTAQFAIFVDDGKIYFQYERMMTLDKVNLKLLQKKRKIKQSNED